MKFGEKLKKMRKELGLTQKEVQEKLINPKNGKPYITLRAYMAYEQDNVRPRKNEIYDALSKVFNCKKDYLYIEDSNIENIISTLGTGVVGTGVVSLGMLLAPVIAPWLEIGTIATKAIIGTSLTSGALISLFDELKGNNVEKEEKVKELIQNIENKQKIFSGEALRVILSKLNEKSIGHTLMNVDLIDIYGENKPDDFLKLSKLWLGIKDWWILYWSKYEYNIIDDEINYESTAREIIMQFVNCSIEKKRKISIVVDSDKLYQAVLSHKRKISLNANISVIQVSKKNGIIKEEYICTCEGANEEKLFKIV